MEDLIIESERTDEVQVFDLLPSDITDGTAYHYYQEFPFMDEELYYILQCATKNDIPKDKCVQLCQQIHDDRNKLILENFGGGQVLECTLSLEDDLNYDISTGIPEQLLWESKGE